MSDLRKAAQQALEALDFDPRSVTISCVPRLKSAAEVLRAALAQPERKPLMQDGIEDRETRGLSTWLSTRLDDYRAWRPEPEPVAWINEHGHIDRGLDAILDPTGWTPLYTAPPQRKPLTDQEAKVLWADVYEPGHHLWVIAERFARAIEAAHGIGGDHVAI